MSRATQNALVIGGGFSGMSAAIALRRIGLTVDLIEIDPEWTCYGAGISIGGATLRAFRTLGILDRFLEQGNAGDGVDVRSPEGRKLAMIPTPRIAGPDIPGSGGIMRPVLARILADEVLASGVKVRTGTTFSKIEQNADGVLVEFDAGDRATYDFVVGADGLMSQVRKYIFPNAPSPKYNSQGVWRAVLPKQPDIDTAVLWVGEHNKVGLNPVSKDAMYLFVNENRPEKRRVNEDTYVDYLKSLLEPFAAEELCVAAQELDASSQINFRPIENLLLPLPWHVGRIVLIGDAVHATTPHLASGAGIGIEDAIVLAEEIARNVGLADALTAFEQRRWQRCRMVVEDSARLGEIETAGGDKGEHAMIMQRAFKALAEAI